MSEERTVNGADDCNRLQSNAVDCGRRELTDRERHWRGLRYFLATFLAAFAPGAAFFHWVSARSDYWFAFSFAICLPVALIVGMIIMDAPDKRLCDRMVVLGVALVSVLLFALLVAGILALMWVFPAVASHLVRG